jgi:hypothetical protein
MSQKILSFILAAVRTWNLTILYWPVTSVAVECWHPCLLFRRSRIGFLIRRLGMLAEMSRCFSQSLHAWNSTFSRPRLLPSMSSSHSHYPYVRSYITCAVDIVSSDNTRMNYVRVFFLIFSLAFDPWRVNITFRSYLWSFSAFVFSPDFHWEYAKSLCYVKPCKRVV